MISSLRIEPARPHHAAALLSLVRELARFEKLEHQVVATEQQMRDELAAAAPVIQASIAWMGEEAVGFALYFHNFSTFIGKPGIYLEDLFVRPEARGRGVGKRLFAYLARTALERGCARLDWAVLDWNEPSIGFYRSFGAIDQSEWTTYRLDGAALAGLAATHSDAE
jgi:GNAT superfamily N-acetyltransferase